MIKELKKLTLTLRKERNPIAPTMVFHVAEIQNIGKVNGNRATTDAEAIQYVKKTVSKLKDEGTSNLEEINLLEDLLPEMTSKEAVKAFLNTLDDTSNKGLVMKAVKEKYGVFVDMKMVAGLL